MRSSLKMTWGKCEECGDAILSELDRQEKDAKQPESVLACLRRGSIVLSHFLPLPFRWGILPLAGSGIFLCFLHATSP